MGIKKKKFTEKIFLEALITNSKDNPFDISDYDSQSVLDYRKNNLRKDDILDIMIPVPSIEEQKRIVAILDCFDTLCSDISAGLPAEIEARQKQYEYYRDKLLTFKEASV